MQYERDIRECVHRAAASRRTASARFGSTIRDSSSRQLNGRRNPADARPILHGEAMRLHRCKMRAAATTWRRRARAFRALRVGGAHPAGCDPFARKRPEKLTKARNYRLNIPALGLRRVVSSGYLSPPLPLAADDKTHQQQPLKCPPTRSSPPRILLQDRLDQLWTFSLGSESVLRASSSLPLRRASK